MRKKALCLIKQLCAALDIMVSREVLTYEYNSQLTWPCRS